MRESVEETRGNFNYSCITKLNIDDLYSESQENLDYIQETLEKRARIMASVLCCDNKEFQKSFPSMVSEEEIYCASIYNI